MNKFKAGLHVLSWLPLFALRFVLFLLGIPIVAYFARWHQDRWQRWTWVWQNKEDQGEPNWYKLRFRDGTPWIFIPAIDWKWDLLLGANMANIDRFKIVARLHWSSKQRVLARYSTYARRFQYMAFRNNANNFRYIFDEPEVYSTSGDPDAFSHDGWSLEKAGIRLSAGWRWSGMFAGYKRTWLKGPGRYSEFYIGWKVGSATPGLGFTLQTRFNRPYIKVDFA